MVIKVGENIALFRKKKGLTQDELAQILMVTNQAVSKWESGKCYPDIALLPELAHLFEVSIDELLVGECFIKTDSTDKEDDSFVLKAIKIAQGEQVLSIMKLQRKLRIGYGRAKKILDDMCESGYIIKDPACDFRYLCVSHLEEQRISSEENE
ncbi:MAG: helix-turn-helix domain-containing protein [Clostridia bacterium]|nr:helix-turn-helix domain-containing protein [Clostridia bacterium]